MKDKLPKPVVGGGELKLPAGGPATSSLSQLKLLPGRVLVEPVDFVESDLIIIPEGFGEDKDKATLGKGKIVALGPSPDVKQPVNVKIGDVVLHRGQHESRTIVIDGRSLRAIALREIQAVVE